MKESRSSISQHNLQSLKGIGVMQLCKNWIHFMNCQWTSPSLFVLVVYCQWTHMFPKTLPKENCANLKRGRKELRWWLNTCVPFIVFAAEEMLNLHLKKPGFTLNVIKSKVMLDRSELKGCRLVDWGFTPCCFTVWGSLSLLPVLISPYPTMT